MFGTNNVIHSDIEGMVKRTKSRCKLKNVVSAITSVTTVNYCEAAVLRSRVKVTCEGGHGPVFDFSVVLKMKKRAF